jgi:hypothetical protein
MKKTLVAVMLAAAFLTTSCISIIEELILNKDGSGTFTYTIDLGGLMEMGIFDQMRAMNEESENAEVQEAIEVDTVVSMYATQEASGTLGNFEDPDFWKKVTLKTVLSESKKIGTIAFELKFEDTKEIDYFMKNLAKVLETDETAGAIAKLGIIGSASGSPYSFSKKSVERQKQPVSQELTDAMNEEGAEMYKMMMTGGEYITIYNLPKKAKKVSNKNATLSDDKQKVTLKVDLLEYLEGKADLSNEVKY